MATAVAEEAHLAPLEALEPSTAVRVMLFLGPRDLARAARASRALRAACFEELVWRSLSLRAWPAAGKAQNPAATDLQRCRHDR